jgi:glycosyltransferase involved in cell wall biosynthesis
MNCTVIIPYVKDRGFLKKAIESVHEQTVECDLILSQSDNSVGYNLNRAIEKCTTEFWVYLCDDDILPVDSVELRMKAMKDNDFIHGNGIVYGSVVASARTPEKKKPTVQDLVEKNHIFGGTGMYRTDLHEKVQWDESLWTGEELDYHMNLLKNDAKIGYVNEFVYVHRIHEEQKSFARTEEYRKKRIKAIKEIRNRYK